MGLSVLDRRSATLGLLTPLLVGCGQAIGKGTVALPDDMTLGSPTTKVTVVEYASVACPVCGNWYKEVYPAFKAKYIDTGKVRFVYREMLVGDGVEVSTAAAGFVLARCAGKDKYFPIVDAIYRSQPGLFADPRNVLVGVAKSAGLSEQQFNACTQDDAAFAALNKRVEANVKHDNVSATPTFVINGRSLEPGYHPLTVLDAAIAKAQAG